MHDDIRPVVEHVWSIGKTIGVDFKGEKDDNIQEIYIVEGR